MSKYKVLKRGWELDRVLQPPPPPPPPTISLVECKYISWISLGRLLGFIYF